MYPNEVHRARSVTQVGCHASIPRRRTPRDSRAKREHNTHVRAHVCAMEANARLAMSGACSEFVANYEVGLTPSYLKGGVCAEPAPSTLEVFARTVFNVH